MRNSIGGLGLHYLPSIRKRPRRTFKKTDTVQRTQGNIELSSFTYLLQYYLGLNYNHLLPGQQALFLFLLLGSEHMLLFAQYAVKAPNFDLTQSENVSPDDETFLSGPTLTSIHTLVFPLLCWTHTGHLAFPWTHQRALSRGLCLGCFLCLKIFSGIQVVSSMTIKQLRAWCLTINSGSSYSHFSFSSMDHPLKDHSEVLSQALSISEGCCCVCNYLISELGRTERRSPSGISQADYTSCY